MILRGFPGASCHNEAVRSSFVVRAFIYTEQSIKLAVLYATLYINVATVVPKQSFYSFHQLRGKLEKKKRCEEIILRNTGYTCNFLT